VVEAIREGLDSGYPWRLSAGEQGGVGAVKLAEEEKVAPWGVGALYSRHRQSTGRQKRRVMRRWVARRRCGAMDVSRQQRSLSEGGRRGPDVVSPWFGPGG
jgi:hypothetical protein